MSDKIKIGSVWEQKMKNGKPYFSGKVSDNLKLLIFPVEKKNDKSPAYEVFWASVSKPQEGGGDTATVPVASFNPPSQDDGEWPGEE